MPRIYKKRPKHIVSYTMSRIRSKNTGIEIIMCFALRKLGVSFRRYYDIIGTPDFIIPGIKLAIFCDSDFWHGYNWADRRHRIKANKGYWLPKIEGNIARDKTVNQELRKQGWSVIRFWEHEIFNNPNKCLEKIIQKVEKIH